MKMRTKMTTRQLTLASILTAIVFVLQFFSTTLVKLGMFATAVAALVPIIIGAATCGIAVATWLGFVFGIAVLASGDAASFWIVSIHGTLITVMLKCTACGFAAGVVYKAIRKISNEYLAVFATAVVCPIVNTGIFILGCLTFFMDYLTEYAASMNWEGSTVGFIVFGFIGVNFLIEFGVSIFLSPTIVRLLQIRK